ncbi:MAG: hypothetical protein QG630_72 [Patescibacteria group bacterium]|nr:hypothetical protein [Patescibacteria group bacterium]
MNKKIFKKLFLVFISIFLTLNFAFAQDTIYRNVSDGLDNKETETISNTSTGGLADTARYIALMASAAIIALVIFKLIEGAVLKGTYDNIYDQQKGNKILKNAVASFLIFIFVNLLFSYINPDYGSWIFNTSSSGGGSSGGGGASGSLEQDGQCINDPVYYSKSVEDQIKQDEEGGKYKSWVYMDTTGHPTIGWGFNLAQSGASQIMKEAGIDNNTISSLLSTPCKNVSVDGLAKAADKNCPTTISKEQADALFNNELPKRKKDAIAWAGGQAVFDKLPENIKKVIINMSYNMGAGKLATFSESGDTKQGLKKADWGQMAHGIVDSLYCTQVKGRCGRLVGLVYDGKCPANTSSTNNTSINSQKKKNAAEVCKQILKGETGDLVDLNDLGVPCKSNQATCLVTKEFGNIVKDVAVNYNKKFPKRTFKVSNAYRSDKQQTEMCTNEKGECAASCKTSNNTHYSNHQLGNAIDVTNDTIGGCLKAKKVCDSDEFKFLKSYSPTFKNNLSADNVHFSMTGK